MDEDNLKDEDDQKNEDNIKNEDGPSMKKQAGAELGQAQSKL